METRIKTVKEFEEKIKDSIFDEFCCERTHDLYLKLDSMIDTVVEDMIGFKPMTVEQTLLDKSFEDNETIQTLFRILIELDARESSSNCIIPDLLNKNWDELCDDAIELFKQLKEENK